MFSSPPDLAKKGKSLRQNKCCWAGLGQGVLFPCASYCFIAEEMFGSKVPMYINNKSVSSFPPSFAYLIQVVVGVIFHLQQVFFYILDKLHPYNPWHGCLYLLQQLLFQSSLAHRSRHPPLLMEVTHTSDELKKNTMFSCRHLHSCSGLKS